MASFILSCDSTADMPRERFDALGIPYVCFHYSVNGKEYPDDLGQSMSFHEFYRAMAEGAETSTSQVNIQEYLSFFEGFLRAGQDVLHVTLSSGLSGAYHSAVNAAGIARERWSERKIYIVDSLCASSGYGMLMEQLAEAREAGMEIDAVRAFAETERLRINHWFFSTDLSYYVKGGRISKASAVFGGMLGICPLLDMDGEGRLVPRYKIRGKKKVVREIVGRMEELAEGGTDYRGRCWISHSDCYEDARAVAELVEQRFPCLNGPVEIFDVGTAIGSHTGPGTVALYFRGAERK